MSSESEIQSSILDFLNKSGVFAFRVNTTGVFDPKSGIFRKPGKFSLPGVSDIIGVYQGKIICIEVKSKTGRVSPDQEVFINKINKCGGVAFVARSIEDVKDGLARAEIKLA